MCDRFRLCALNDLADPGSTLATVPTAAQPLELIVVRSHGTVFGYRNVCPHTGGPLDWTPGVFLDVSKRYLQCATHDALFRIEDGYCVHGPCTGDRLHAESLICEDGVVWWVPEHGVDRSTSGGPARRDET